MDSADFHSSGFCLPRYLAGSGTTQSDLRACVPACTSISANAMGDIYTTVTAQGLPNFIGTKCPLPSNFKFNQWNLLVHTGADRETIACLMYGFSAN